MPNTRTANAVRLEFAPGCLVQSNLSGAAFTGDWLWVAGDEACSLSRLRRLEPVGPEALRFGEPHEFPLADLLDLPGKADEEADLEGLAVVDGWLWLVGSHGLKRKNAKPDRGHTDNAKRLAKLALDGNRRLLACVPIELDGQGHPCLVRRAADGRRALRLRGDAASNLLTQALADDPHFGPYMAIPRERQRFRYRRPGRRRRATAAGLAWPRCCAVGRACLKCTSRPAATIFGCCLWTTLVCWSASTFSSWTGWAYATCTFLAMTSTSWPARPWFSMARSASSDGLVQGPTWLPIGSPWRFEPALSASVSLPYGRGTNRAEAICDVPSALAGRKPSWLVLYDAPGADRREGEHIVFGDLLRHD